MEQIPKKPIDLLYFGLDYLIVNIGITSPESPTIKFLNSLFSISHNSTNANTVHNVMWMNSNQTVSLHFGEKLRGTDQVVYIYSDRDPIFAIEKIDTLSTMRSNLKYKYDFRISYYGAFFNKHRLNQLQISEFWQSIITDIQNNVISHSITRIDICADLTNIKPCEVRDEITFKYYENTKKLNEFKMDVKHREPETIYYGNKKDKRWFIRIYNKIADIHYKGKEYQFIDYLLEESVTRLEIQINSPVCKECSVTLEKCLENRFLFGIFVTQLNNQTSHWNTVDTIENILRKKNFEAFRVTRIKKGYTEMSNSNFFKRTVNKMVKCAMRFNVPPEKLVAQAIPVMRAHPNWNRLLNKWKVN